jgi:hypothetical protein
MLYNTPSPPKTTGTFLKSERASEKYGRLMTFLETHM